MRKLTVAAVSGTCALLMVSLLGGPAQAASDDGAAGQGVIAELQSEARSGNDAAVSALTKYEGLSSEDKRRFDAAAESLAAGSEPEQVEGVSVTASSGSVPVRSAARGGVTLLAAGGRSYSGWCSQQVSILGVTVTETRIDADFDTFNGRVTGIRNARDRVVTNFQPFTTVDFRDRRTEVSGGTGYVRSLVSVTRGPVKGLSSNVENWQTMAMNGSGSLTACRFGW